MLSRLLNCIALAASFDQNFQKNNVNGRVYMAGAVIRLVGGWGVGEGEKSGSPAWHCCTPVLREQILIESGHPKVQSLLSIVVGGGHLGSDFALARGFQGTMDHLLIYQTTLRGWFIKNLNILIFPPITEIVNVHQAKSLKLNKPSFLNFAQYHANGW